MICPPKLIGKNNRARTAGRTGSILPSQKNCSGKNLLPASRVEAQIAAYRATLYHEEV
jgi:hypothetical protein